MSEIPEVFAIFEQKLAHVLSFTVVPLKSKDLKNALEEILTYFSGIVERASKAESRIAGLEEENDRLQDGWFRDETICPDGSLRPKVSDLLNRIAELSQAVGLITTMKPTMVMDANHPLDMVREVGEHVTARIAELEAAQRWIPVSEPPKVSGKYLLLNIYNDVYPCDFIAGTEIWVLPDYDTITHWMPLPQLPEERER